MPEKQSQSRADQRRAWDASYRAKNREKRRAYDRERMRKIREAQDER